MPRVEMSKKFSFVKEFTANLSNKNEMGSRQLDFDNSKLNGNAIKWYTDGSKMAEGTAI